MARENPPASILTKTQRTVLGSSASAPQEKYNSSIKYDIKQRLLMALIDASTLREHYEQLELDDAFEDGDIDRAELRQGAVDLIYALYRGLFAHDIPFRHVLGEAVWHAERDLNDREVTSSFHVEQVETGVGTQMTRAADMARAGRVAELRYGEMAKMIDAIAFSDADIGELVHEGLMNQFDVPSPEEREERREQAIEELEADSEE